MASSLQAQLQMLISNEDSCGDLSTSYLRGILECAYAFGGTAGIFWGYISDRIGRRPVTLVGLFAMSICCICTGFATDLTSCAIFRFFAGICSSTTMVTSLTMIGDLSVNQAERTKYIARVPLVALLGSVESVLQAMFSGSVDDADALWQKFPILNNQIGCGGLIFVIAVTSTIVLKEVSSPHV